MNNQDENDLTSGVRKNTHAVQTRFGLPAIILVFVGYFAYYTSICSANVVWQGWFVHIPMIEKYYAGTFQLQDTGQLFWEHRLSAEGT